MLGEKLVDMELDDVQLEEASGGKSKSDKKYVYACQACGKNFKATKAEMKIVLKKCNETLCKKCGKWKDKWFD